MLLKSQAYYELSDNCDLLFGDCACIYYTGKVSYNIYTLCRELITNDPCMCHANVHISAIFMQSLLSECGVLFHEVCDIVSE